MTMRWTASRKAAIVWNVRNGMIPLAAALGAHDLTLEEYTQWDRLYGAYGPAGLRTTKLQQYRRKARSTKARKTTPQSPQQKDHSP
jgi:hypothetical protein